MTTATPALDPRTTALLVMDFQQGLLASLPGLPAPEALLSRVLSAIADLRKHGAVIAYVRVGFTEADWAAIPPGNKTFSYLGQQRLIEVPQIFRTGDPIGFSPERNGIKCRGKRTITLRSSRSRPSEKWSTPRRLGQSPKWRENSM
jgi:hypothetical protein